MKALAVRPGTPNSIRAAADIERARGIQ